MKKITMMISLFVFGFVTLVENSYAKGNDVFPIERKRGDLYVRVTKTLENRVKFEKCNLGYEATTCAPIGNKRSYSFDDLTDQRYIEQAQVAGSVIGDALVVLGAVYLTGAAAAAGSAIEFVEGAGTINASLLTGTTGGLVSGGIATASLANLDSLNPAEQYRQSEVLSENVILDKPVTVEDMNGFISRLELVLSKL